MTEIFVSGTEVFSDAKLTECPYESQRVDMYAISLYLSHLCSSLYLYLYLYFYLYLYLYLYLYCLHVRTHILIRTFNHNPRNVMKPLLNHSHKRFVRHANRKSTGVIGKPARLQRVM